ncbi:hypothetical protein NW759_001837 [Fusarium solani]|nr:hypothetical protein NW759_001837 [Fusarium solani]
MGPDRSDLTSLPVGRAIAIALAGEGAKIVLCDLQEKANAKGYEADVDKTTGDIIAARGGDSIFLQTDIASSAAIQETFSRALEASALLLFRGRVGGALAKIAAFNTLGTARISRSAIRQFLQQEVDEKWGSQGRIVNISSCASVTGFPGEVAYSTTKASVDHMTRARALDHAKDSININCVAPGVVATGIARGNLENSTIHQTIVKATPWPRLGTVDDIAAAILFLCLPQSQWITGQILPVDGGMTISISA